MQEYTTFQEYCDALNTAPYIGIKMKERILDHAANNPNILLSQLMQLVKLAYPEEI